MDELNDSNPANAVPALPPNLGLHLPRPSAPVGPLPQSKRKIPLKPLLVGGGLAVFLLIGFIAGRGKTSANQLEIGDCFEIPSGQSFRDVTDQDCAGPHEAQAFARVSNGSESFAADECVEKLIPLIAVTDAPDDLDIATIEGDRSGSFLCVALSDSGSLTGSIVDN